MNIKPRGHRYALYRSRWIPSGPQRSHGYSVQDYVGSLPKDAESIPEPLVSQLRPDEVSQLMRDCCGPARVARVAREDAATVHANDPLWRVAEAARLLEEAAALARTTGRPLHWVQLRGVTDVMARLQTETVQPNRASPALGATPGQGATRPTAALEAALAALAHAAQAVRDGAVGIAPESAVRTTRVYQLWSRITAAVTGPEDSSLQSALQSMGWVSRRGR